MQVVLGDGRPVNPKWGRCGQNCCHIEGCHTSKIKTLSGQILKTVKARELKFGTQIAIN